MLSYFLRNARTVLRDGDTARRYLRWLACRMTGATPSANLEGVAELGFWKSFSEFNHYSSGIDRNEFKLIRRCLNEGGAEAIGFDVGANIGLFTCYMGRLGFKEVHSFEPVPETWCRLRKNIEKNRLTGQTFSTCVAIGDNSGFITFELNEAAPGRNGLAAKEARCETNITVPSASLDAYCDRFGISRIHFMKVDVEGMELFVLQGGREMLRGGRIDVILIEVCPANLLRVGISPGDLYEVIVELRLSAYRLGKDGESTQKLSKMEFEEFGSENVVLRPAAADQ